MFIVSWTVFRNTNTFVTLRRALAKNCAAPIDAKKGAEATDWQAGKPVRVVRNYKGHVHSEYAPEDGNRYDGIYKVKYPFCISFLCFVRGDKKHFPLLSYQVKAF